MPERIPLKLDWDPDSIRAEVIDRAANVELIAGGVRVRAAAVPLFRATASGGLEQAIRVEAGAGSAGATVSVATDGDSELDRVTLTGDGIAQLFVPEVRCAHPIPGHARRPTAKTCARQSWSSRSASGTFISSIIRISTTAIPTSSRA